jgi:hypothetical protein
VVVTVDGQMTSLYDTIADSCAALAAKTKNKSAKAPLQQLVEQWHSVATDQEREAVRRPFALFESTKPLRPTKPSATMSRRLLRRGRPKKKP